MKKIFTALFAAALFATRATAKEITVEITNLTNGIYFTPLLVAKHNAHADLFEPGIPADPGGNGGTGATGVTTVEHNMTVHIHRGTLGDDDANGGLSDLNRSVHRWLNPVAKVTIHVNKGVDHGD